MPVNRASDCRRPAAGVIGAVQVTKQAGIDDFITLDIGGTSADVCQKNLGATLQIIIDSITGLASPAKLQYVPISASLAVAIGKQQLNRSRQSGFDYRPIPREMPFMVLPSSMPSRGMAY